MKLSFPSLSLNRSLCASCALQARQQQLRLLHINLKSSPRKYFHASPPRRNSSSSSSSRQQTQAQPLGGFYEDLLTTPIVPQAAQTQQQSSYSDVEESPLAEESEGPKIFYGAERKYRGGTSSTPDSTWRTVNGVPVPPRPDEPDNCCMSGCVHCVWDDYRDEVEGWAVRVRQAQAKASGAGMHGSPKVRMARPEVVDAAGSMDDDGGGSEGLWESASTVVAPEGEDLFQGIPVGIREFMATEKRLRDRKRRRRKTLENEYDD